MHRTDGFKTNSKDKNAKKSISKLEYQLLSKISLSKQDTAQKVTKNFKKNEWGEVVQQPLALTESVNKSYLNKNFNEDFVQTGTKDVQQSVAKLIEKAKNITQNEQSQQKIKKAKMFKVSTREQSSPFLTGTGIYSVEQQKPLQQQEQGEAQIDNDELLKGLVEREKCDDLEQLRRMIKITGKNLKGYQRQISESSKGVITAANQMNQQVDCILLHKVSRVNSSNSNKIQPKNKGTYSLNRIKNPKYK